jgi:subtilisin family serine protease
MTEKTALKLGQNPLVDYIEENDLSESDELRTSASSATTSSLVNQTTLPFPGNWGLDRIDQRNLPLNRTYSYTSTGAGVTAYVIDTGINVFHNEFQGRITDITDLVQTNDHPTGYYGQDCVGHGTHVAAILGGTTYGVAKGVSLHPIRVGEIQDCYNPFQIRPGISNSTVIEAIELILRNPKRPAVVNFSIYDYDGDIGVDNAVRELIRAGLPVVAGVGDHTGDVGGSPARVWEVIAVGATNASDQRISWTEVGPALDVFAPGDTILSAWYNSPTATEYLSGTSMATPHVSGVVARYLQNNPTATPAQVHQFITSTATAGIVQNVPVGSQNKLLYAQP